MKDKALRLALEALGHFEKAGLATLKTIDAITAIKQALEQPEPEPVRLECVVCGTVYADGVPPQVSPPKREWQGLTDEEMQKITKSVAKRCADIAETAEPYESADLIRKHFGVEK